MDIKNLAYPLVLGLILCGTICAGNQVIHVATGGSDSNPGNQAAPLKTIQTALKVAKSGDTIEIAPGIYRESIELSPAPYR